MKRNFNRQINTIKGYYGEMITKKRLRNHNWSVLSDEKPIKHSFDFLIQKDKYDIRICEVKVCNELHGKYSNSNGVNYKNHLEYIKLNNEINIPFMLIFVDVLKCEIYGGNYKDIIKIQNHDKCQFPKKIEGRTGEKMLFSKLNMNSYGVLTPKEESNFKIIDEYKKRIIIPDDELDKLIYYLFEDDEFYLSIMLKK